MDDSDAPNPKAISNTLGFAALIAAGLAIFASGGLAILALAASFACLAGSIAAALAENRESDCERSGREYEQAALADQASEPALCESLPPGQGKCWTRAVSAEISAGRSR